MKLSSLVPILIFSSASNLKAASASADAYVSLIVFTPILILVGIIFLWVIAWRLKHISYHLEYLSSVKEEELKKKKAEELAE